MKDKNGQTIDVGDGVSAGTCKGWVYETYPKAGQVEVVVGYDDEDEYMLAIVNARHLAVTLKGPLAKSWLKPV